MTQREIKVWSISEAVESGMKLAHACNVHMDEQTVFKYILNSCKLRTLPGIEDAWIEFRHLNNFLLNFMKAMNTGDYSLMRQERGLKWPMVPLDEFIDSKEYMGQRGHVRPAIRTKYYELFENENYVEGVLTGAIGIGKNYLADLAVARMLYELSCYVNPQMEYDLAPGSSLVFIMQSMSYSKAKRVVFDQFAERLKMSSYFQKNFMWDTNVRSELRFPNNIYVIPVAGTDTAALGMNVYGGIIDEMNFMKRSRDSVALEWTGGEEYDQAENVYLTLIRRMKSRFQQKGRLPGKLLLVSSVHYPGDFTDRKMKEAEKEMDKTGKTSIMVMKYAIWESLPPDRFSPEKFLVEVGNDTKRSRIINSYKDAVDEGDVIKIPIDLKPDFEKDLEASLRDHAGIATGTKHPFIPQRELIQQAQDTFVAMHQTRQLFLQNSVALSTVIDPLSPDFELIVDHEYIQGHIVDPAMPFACHVDVGLTHDALGLAIGHINSYILLPQTRVFNPRTQDFVEVSDTRVPCYHIDGLLQVTPPPGGEIDLELVRDMIVYLKGYLNIKWASMDQYQSAVLLQALRKHNIRSGVMSIDSTLAPYIETKQAIKDERLLFPAHAVAARELRDLERDPEKDKIDHPSGGSKDVSDAIAGVVYMLQLKEASYGRAASVRGNRHGKVKGVRKIRVGRGSGRRRIRVV